MKQINNSSQKVKLKITGYAVEDDAIFMIASLHHHTIVNVYIYCVMISFIDYKNGCILT